MLAELEIPEFTYIYNKLSDKWLLGLSKLTWYRKDLCITKHLKDLYLLHEILEECFHGNIFLIKCIKASK